MEFAQRGLSYRGVWPELCRHFPIPLDRQDGGQETAKFLLSGEKTDNPSELNSIFLENWCKYQDDVVMNGNWIDLIQVLCVSVLSDSSRD